MAGARDEWLAAGLTGCERGARSIEAAGGIAHLPKTNRPSPRLPDIGDQASERAGGALANKRSSLGVAVIIVCEVARTVAAFAALGGGGGWMN